MTKVTHLSETFDDEFADITARIRQEIYWAEYDKLYTFIKDKDLVGATKYLEELHEASGDLSMFNLSMIRSCCDSWHEFYCEVKDMIDAWERLHQAVIDWVVLMHDNGGSKQVTKLARKRRKRLPAIKPVSYTVDPVIKFRRL